jgi:phosphatidylinositol glycan class O
VEMKAIKKPSNKLVIPISNSIFFNSIRWKILLITISLSVLIRSSWYYWDCREEQSRACNFDNNITLSMCVLAIIIFATCVTTARYYLRSLGNLSGCSPAVLVSKYSPTIGVVCCGCYWVLLLIPSNAKSTLLLPFRLQLLPQIVLGISILSIVVLFYRPISSSNVLETISQPDRVVEGLYTVYSATFINLGVFLSLIMAILLGESRVLLTTILMTCIISLSITMSIIRHNRANQKGRHSCSFSYEWKFQSSQSNYVNDRLLGW